MRRLDADFFSRDVLEVAPGLLGKYLVRAFSQEGVRRHLITEVEAYRGEEDMACHARFGKTERNKVMYDRGGTLYVYMIYGMYWMLNIVTGGVNVPQAVLIRGIGEYQGPGKLTRGLRIDKSFYGECLSHSGRIWVENGGNEISYRTTPRIGIDYAGQYWKNIEWRYVLEKTETGK